MFKQSNAAASAAATVSHQPWVEKYRPKDISDLSAQEEIVQVLARTAESHRNNLPHLLFYGPPGTGKTSAILALARRLYGSELHNRVLELNASNERGIQVVRDKVKQFAQSAVKQNDKMPTFKLIILDEADSMTADAQSALRRTMETYSKITRFCLICNYVSRIIEPLASRCAKFRFKPLPIQSSLDRLQYIAEQEHAASTDEGLQAIIDVSEGDLRKAITILQSASRMTGGLRPVDAAMVREIAGIVPQSALVEFVEAASAKDLSVITDCTRRLMMQGYSGHQFLSQLHDFICQSEDLTGKHKTLFMAEMGAVEKRLIDGADEHLNLLHLGMHLNALLLSAN